jgi:hypothetical protein
LTTIGSQGAKETDGRVALLVFREIVLGTYGEKLVGPVPRFPAAMEQRINVYLNGYATDTTVVTKSSPSPMPGALPLTQHPPGQPHRWVAETPN